MTKLFGTDGIRGLAGQELTSDLFLKVAYVGAQFLQQKSGLNSVVVGCDPRESAAMLKTAVMAGICAAGLDVIDVGLLPTPAIAYLTKTFKAAGGAVISASHNPANYNGLKFFDYQGVKLSEAEEEAIEEKLAKLTNLTTKRFGQVKQEPEAFKLYLNYLKTIAEIKFNFKVALDCAHGATSFIAPELFRQLGAKVQALCCQPDGKNINANCGSTHIANLQRFVQANDVDLGFAFDGDGDRVLAVSADGFLVDGDFIMAILAANLSEVVGQGIVVTVMTNLGFDLAMQKLGVKVEKTNVGDRFVLEKMLSSGYKFGGEQSGHILALNYNSTGDGLITAILLLKAMQKTKQPLTKLAQVMQRLPQVLINVPINGHRQLAQVPSVKAAIEAAQAKVGSNGRILVRPSGTEPVVRVMVESTSESLARELALSICEAIKKAGS